MTLTIGCGFFLIGLTLTVFGTTNGYLLGHFDTTISRLGLFISFMSAGRVSAVLFTWSSAGKIKGKTLFQAGILLITAGMFGIGLIPYYALAIFLFFAMGIGHGLIDVSGSMLTAAVHPQKFGRAMNSAHMYVGIGSLLGPLTAGMILSLSDNWQSVYFSQGVFGLLLLLIVTLITYPEAKPVKQQKSYNNKKKSLFSFAMIILSAVILLYSGAGQSLNAWVSRYMSDSISLPAFFAAGTIAVYNLGLTLGRLLCSLYIEKAGYSFVLRAGAVGSLISISGVIFSTSSVIILICLFATGLFFGGLFPTTITAARNLYPDRLTVITSILILAASLGVMTVPALTGFVAQSAGISGGMRILVIPVIIMTAAVFMVKGKKKQETY